MSGQHSRYGSALASFAVMCGRLLACICTGCLTWRAGHWRSSSEPMHGRGGTKIRPTGCSVVGGKGAFLADGCWCSTCNLGSGPTDMGTAHGCARVRAHVCSKLCSPRLPSQPERSCYHPCTACLLVSQSVPGRPFTACSDHVRDDSAGDHMSVSGPGLGQLGNILTLLLHT